MRAPVTQSDSVIDIIHGTAVSDPYRWLEEQDSPATRRWLQEQAIYTRSYLDAIPGRERLEKRIQELLSIDVLDSPHQVGNRFFFRKRSAFQEQAVIEMQTEAGGSVRTLFDPNKILGGPAVDIACLSGSGRFLALSVRDGGQDSETIRVLDVDRRILLPDHIPHGQFWGLSFCEEPPGIFHSCTPSGLHQSAHRSVYWHRLGTDWTEDVEVLRAGNDERMRIYVTGSWGSRYVLYMVRVTGDQQTRSLYAQVKDRSKAPSLIVDRIPDTFVPRLHANTAFCLCSFGAPNRKIIAIDIDTPAGSWRTVVPESQARIHDFAIAGQRIFVKYVGLAGTRIEIFDFDGHAKGVIPCSTAGTIRLLRGDPAAGVLFYQVSSFLEPPTIVRFDPHTDLNVVWTSRQVPFDSSSLEMYNQDFISKDGTRVPISLFKKKSERSRPAPTVLTCYGGFGTSFTPRFSTVATFLVEKGCLYSIAHVRGGSEFGAEWHDTAKRRKKQNAIDDLIAAAEWLVQQGYSTPGRVSVVGGSNSGLLLVAAVMQRPDLFRAAVSVGPLLDMLRYQLFETGSNWVEEYGWADDEEDFRALVRYSPYHNVRSNTSYPSMLFVSGDADTRCNPMHARKMTARLQAATCSAHPILLDYRPTWGHIPVQPLNNRISAITDRVSFLCKELGVDL